MGEIIGEQDVPAASPQDAVTMPQLQGHLDHLREWIDSLVGESQQCRSDREHFGAFEHDVVADLRRIHGELERLSEHVTARPFMQAESALDVRAPQDTVRMGYLDPAAEPGDGAYAAFESIFRGSREQVRSRQLEYVDTVVALFDTGDLTVLDLGCGRGEFLEALAERGVRGVGVDSDEGMVREAQAAGVEARVADLFDELATHADASVHVVFSAQVIEHLAPSDMQRLLDEIHRVLVPEGIAVLETVNPHSLRALRFFWLDLTHVMPVYPESALMLARGAGFRSAVITFPGADGAPLAQTLREAGDFALVVAHDAQTLVRAGLVAATQP